VPHWRAAFHFVHPADRSPADRGPLCLRHGQRSVLCHRKMDTRLSDDPILSRFRAALTETYGDRLARAVLFGSRARGDARPESDYDIAVFIRSPDAWFTEVVRLADLGTDILLETGAVISAKPFPAEAYNERLPLLDAIRTEGLDL
jgi:predicted nucleotidyltransferase